MLAAAVLAPTAALAVTDAERVAVYRQFRAAFDAHRYPDALPLAEKLVALTQEQYGANGRELVNPLANLGTTRYRMGDYKDAEEAYLRSVKIAADTGGNGDRLLLRPLQGLGATYYATRQYEDASVTLQRALDLSRNLDGLLNPGQMPILYPLIGSLVNLERHGEADREFQYAVRVAQSAWGSTDARVIRPLDRYAHWLEHMGRYPSASVGGSPDRGGRGLNPDGEKALLLALQTIDKMRPVDHELRGRSLMELGDWYLCADQADKSLARYREAWKEFQQAGSTAPLDAPR